MPRFGDQERRAAGRPTELVRRCLAGDQGAMVELVARYQGPIYGLCFRMLGQRQDAEDMTQETFLRALRNLASWDPTRDFEPWLFAIAGNRCRTLLATRKRRPAAQSLGDESPAADDPDLQAARNLAEEVQLALDGVRDEYRQAFVLFHEQELSYAEIAAAMDCPVGTVKTWIHRARKDLIERLRERGVVQETSDAVRRI